MATVDKNFRIKNGLVVEGSVATVNGNQILTENASDQYILNLIGGETLVKSVTGNLSVDNSGQLSINESGLASDLAGTRLYADGSSINVDVEGIADDLIGSFGIATTTDISNAISNASSNYDAAGSASGVQSNLDDHISDTSTHGVNGDIVGTSDSQTLSNKTFAGDVVFQSAGGAGGSNNKIEVNNNTGDLTLISNSYGLNLEAANDVKLYSDGGNIILNAGNSYLNSASAENEIATKGYVDTASTNALNDAKSYTDQEVAALVDSAPALLDTLNELAAAIADNPNYASDVANLIAGKQDTLTASTGITIDGSNNISVTANTYDAYGAASTAQGNAESYADSLAGNYDPAGAADTALQSAEGYADQVSGQALADAQNYTDSAISNGNSSATPSYRAINLGGYTEQVGSWAQAGTAATQVTAFSYSASWGSAEFLVRVMSNTSGHQHSQLSKLLVTTDGAGNVAITEYGIVTTNGNMGDVTASNVGGTINILVTPTYASSEVIVSGTLLAYND